MSTPTASARIPHPISPGAEMERLARFHRDMTWSGTIRAGGMGPGTPEMSATGRGVHHLIQDGNWIVGTYEQDQFLSDGLFLFKWQLHWVAGWDPANRDYRATVADNYGHADVMRGWIEGDRLVFESANAGPARLRLTWDVTNPDVMTWRNEISVGGAPFALVEEYRCTPI